MQFQRKKGRCPNQQFLYVKCTKEYIVLHNNHDSLIYNQRKEGGLAYLHDWSKLLMTKSFLKNMSGNIQYDNILLMKVDKSFTKQLCKPYPQ